MAREKTPKKIDNLKYKSANAWDVLPPRELKDLEAVAGRYRRFLDTCRTERETITHLIEAATKAGFVPLESVLAKAPVAAGKKVYWVSKNRAIGMAILGKRPISEGIHLIAAHHDVPHLDLKAVPLIEKHGLALLKTHYYGGIKKYHWCGMPLAVHCFAQLQNGKTVRFVVGEDADDPVMTITDVPPHLSGKVQNDRKATEVFSGEELQVLAGHRPKARPEKDGTKVKGEADPVKTAVLEHLHRAYGLVEEDLAWAEIAVVPAIPTREVGLDRSMIGGFGHDDRACVFAAWEALKEVKTPERTAAVLFFDKEEIGSAGASGAQSHMVLDFVNMLATLSVGATSYAMLRDVVSESRVLSADTNAPIDPGFESAWDPANSGLLGHGVWICKFTGSGGKYGSSEADVEFIASLRKLFAGEKVPVQFGEMGKVDAGGGGTVAKFLAQFNMHVVDIALPVLGLHSPFEVLSKVDLYYSVKGYRAFLAKAV